MIRITRMVAGKLLASRLDISGLLKSRRPAQSQSRLVQIFSVSSDDPDSLAGAASSLLPRPSALAHVARAAALARTLDPDRYDVHLACDRRYLHLFENLPFPFTRSGLSTANRFGTACVKGNPLYTVTNSGVCEARPRLLAALNPDVVVGDFRLSLSVSARVAAIPYMTVTNAHWSPYARPHFVVPDLAITQRFGPRLGQMLFTLMRPVVFAQQAIPLNKIRQEYGLPSVGYSLPNFFTEADETLYADLPDLVPTFDRPESPLSWSGTLVARGDARHGGRPCPGSTDGLREPRHLGQA